DRAVVAAGLAVAEAGELVVRQHVPVRGGDRVERRDLLRRATGQRGEREAGDQQVAQSRLPHRVVPPRARRPIGAGGRPTRWERARRESVGKGGPGRRAPEGSGASVARSATASWTYGWVRGTLSLIRQRFAT